MDLLDTTVTVLLFVGLVAWVWGAVVIGGFSVMLADSGTPGTAGLGVLVAAVGTPATVIATYVIAVVSAFRAEGLTFWIPLLALGVGTVAAVVVWAIGCALVVVGLRLFGSRPAVVRPADVLRRSRRVTGPPPDATAHSSGGTDGITAPAGVPTGGIQQADSDGPGSAPVFGYTVIQRIQDGSLTLELGIEKHTGRRYLRTPMPQRGGEYDEYHGLDVREYATFGSDPTAAARFAAECRDGRHRNRWLPPAGFPALEPLAPGHTRLAGRIATVLTDRPTDAAGAATALPPGLPFVRIVDDTVAADGTLTVSPVDDPTLSVRVAAHQLGRPPRRPTS